MCRIKIRNAKEDGNSRRISRIRRRRTKKSPPLPVKAIDDRRMRREKKRNPLWCLVVVCFVCFFFHFNFNFGGRNEKNGSENATGNARNDAENTTGEIGRESTTASVAIRFLSNRWVSF